MANKSKEPEYIEKQRFTKEELSLGITKLRRRIDELNQLIAEKAAYDSGLVESIERKIRDTVGEIFGTKSRRYAETDGHEIVSAYGYSYLEPPQCQQAFLKELPNAVMRLQGGIEWLEEKQLDQEHVGLQASKKADDINWTLIHPDVVNVSQKKLEDGHFADAVESAFKAVNERVKAHVKKQRGTELDGTSLMQTAFSPNNPIIVLADQSTQSGKDEQAGYMSIFAGSLQGIRNPKTHSNLLIARDRAIHLLFLASLLMFRLDEAKV